MISYNLETSVLLRDGITESLRHEETLEGLSSYFLLKAGTINQNHKLRLGCSVLIQLGLENFQSWRLYNLSGQPVPMGGYLHNSFFFFLSLCSQLLGISPFFNFRPPPLVLLPWTTVKDLPLCLCCPPRRHQGLMLGTPMGIFSAD